jgi:RNA polymerase sigma-70 factor (ECF subfamily)
MTMPQPDPRPTSPLAPADPPGLSDHRLFERVRTGDAAAFELIMRHHNRRLFRLARGVLGNGAKAEDVVQQIYVRAFAKAR